MTQTSAWVRGADTTYGQGKLPFGPCQMPGCSEPACFRIPANDNAQRLVCLDHKPSSLFFVPFLGQQEKLFKATERWVLGGGGAGGSKTYAGARLWLKQHQREHQRWKKGEIAASMGWALFLRRTIPELAQVVEDFKRYKDRLGPHGWHEQTKTFTCECGYKVQFGGMENDDDWQKFYGGAYTLVVIDEAWQFTKKQILEIDSRIRCADPVLDKQVQLYLLTNPLGSITKQWMKRRFVNVAPPETRVKIKTKLADGRVVEEWQVYIPSNLFDNPALVRSGRYEANLRKKSQSMVRSLLYNDWDVDEGAWVGDDWDPSVHVVKPFPIPKSWPRFKCGDYGKSSRTAVHWIAVDPEGSLVVYRSWSCRGLTATEAGHRLREIEKLPLIVKFKETGERIQVVGPEWDDGHDCSTVRGPMDAALWANDQEYGESRGEILERIGTGFYPSDKGTRVRHDAAEQILYRLRDRRPDPFRDGEFVPGIRFFRGTTETRIPDGDGGWELTGPTHTIPSLPFDENDPDVPDTDADDHDWDALAYGVMSRPMGGDKDEDAEVIDFLAVRASRAAVAGSSRIEW